MRIRGGAVVVMDSCLYRSEAIRQLSDTSTYTCLKSNPTMEFTKDLVSLLDRGVAAGIFSEADSKMFIPAYPIMPVFHHLPKIHKGLVPLTGRPIVAGIGSLNERLGEWVDGRLQPLVSVLPGYLRDTKHLLCKLSGVPWQHGYRWMSYDVCSLYSSIPHDLGLQAVSHFLKESGHYSLVLQEFIVLALKYLLTHKFFMFDGVFYLQRCGASMGAKFSPSLANLYMGWWEKSRIFGGTSPRRSDTVIYCRYIDDLLLVISDESADLDEWLVYLNDNELNLRFTGNLQPTTIEFLDLKLTGADGIISTSLFRKSTAGNALLRADSSHPPHTINSIPYGQFLRLKRLCTSPVDFTSEALEMAHRFKDRGYSATVVNNALRRVNAIPRDSLLDNRRSRSRSPNSMNNETAPIFSTSYSMEFYKIKQIIIKYLPVLYSDASYTSILSKGIKTVSRRAPTLGGVLSPSLFESKPTSSTWLDFVGTFKCGTNGCRYCPLIGAGKVIRSCSSGRNFFIKQYINCNTKFVVYVITCNICNVQYVGRTIRRLRDRLSDHLYDIDKNHNTNVARHWNNVHDKNISSLSIQGIERIVCPVRGGDRFKLLCKREVYCIFHLNSRQPWGLNFDWDVSHFHD